MTDVRAAYDPNRLPWLNDLAAPRRTDQWRGAVVWALIALIMVAAAGYWAGMRSVTQVETAATEDLPTREDLRSSEATIALPVPRIERSAPPQVEPPAAAEIQPLAPPPLVRMAKPEALPRRREESPRVVDKPPPAATRLEVKTSAAPEPTIAPAPQVQAPVVYQRAPLALWPANVSQGAAGRVVRIGTFSSRLGAKRAWKRIMRVYPGMTRLKAVVVSAPSMRNGRNYYRLQFGTTSQAHSAVLCQRMRIVGQSCIVVGTPGA